MNNKSYRPEDLQLIREFWKEQEDCLKEAKRDGRRTFTELVYINLRNVALILCILFVDPSVQESILDLQIMKSTGSYIGEHIRELKTNVVQFSPIEFAEKLVTEVRFLSRLFYGT